MNHDAPSSGPAAGTMAELLASTPYYPIRLLGSGGMGEVYLIEHRFLGARFALKVPHAELAHDRQFLDRVRIEAQASARLRHPNVVDIVDFWIGSDGRPFLVMEHLQGHTLREELAVRGHLSRAEALDWGVQALSAIAAAHAMGIVHRDIKLENLFLQDVPGSSRVLKVLDFGVARVLPDAAKLAPAPLEQGTVTGTRVGSPRYMSPEAARGEKLDRRADVYSMGVVLYVMLTGHGPLKRGEGPAQHAAEVGAELDAIVLRALHPSLEERYASGRDFLADLCSLRDAADMRALVLPILGKDHER